MVIFTTAYNHYAVEGFELNAIDYLMKPISFERLQSAINKAEEQYVLKQNMKETLETPSLFVFSEYNKVKILHEEIVYIEGLKDYVKIFVSSKSKPILTRSNLKGIEQKLNSVEFVRIHNSIIVQLSKISSFNKSNVYIDKIELPIGKKFLEAFLKKINPNEKAIAIA